jgi:hypothetical protein
MTLKTIARPVGLFAAALSFIASAANASPKLEYQRDIIPLLQTYCFECHGNGKKKGGLQLDDYSDVKAVHSDREAWESILANVRAHDMPSEEAEKQPTDEERQKIVSWIEQELLALDSKNPDPGFVALRRMNRAEYKATIRDLVGVDYEAEADFPPDDSGYGFDNIADVLSLSPVLFEKYFNAAEKILDQAIVTDPIKSQARHVPASLAQIGFNALGDRGDGWVQLISLEEDDAAVEFNLPAGDYVVRVQAYAKRTGGALKGSGSDVPIEFTSDPGPTKLAILLNNVFIRDFELTNDEKNPGIYEARVGVPTGKQRFRAAVLRKRGGDNENYMLNGRIGEQQPGIVFVRWIEVIGPENAHTQRFPSKSLEADASVRLSPAGEHVLATTAGVAARFGTSSNTKVILRAQAFAQQAGNEPARLAFEVNGTRVKTFDVLAPAEAVPPPGKRVFSTALLAPVPHVYETELELPAGQHAFRAVFVNPHSDPSHAIPQRRERSITVQSLEVVDVSKPVGAPPIPEPLAADFALGSDLGENERAARVILSSFTRRAWRRPVSSEELDPLLRLYTLAREQGDSFAAGVKLAMKAALVSPNFLLIGETKPQIPRSPGPRPVDEHALASRLSYFLWSSMPDEELLAAADAGHLRRDLDLHVRRMLKSPKARALVDNFAGQWLQTRSLETFQPDKQLFPEYDTSLRRSMQRETELFFEHVLKEDRSVLDFLTGNYTFINSQLAKFYGLPFEPQAGAEYQQVALDKTPRRGVLTHASILTLTSNPTRTSPVKRGKWVLENLLGTPPPPPPPNVPELEEEGRVLAGTLRQQMEQHRQNPSCASCHARMDPIGFALENFNAIGAWRDKEGESSIDASGRLSNGDTFNGAAELVALLAEKRQKDFLSCLAEKLLTYALGRGTESYDRPAIDQIVKKTADRGHRFSSLVLAVAESYPFQMRRGDESSSSNVAFADARLSPPNHPPQPE